MRCSPLKWESWESQEVGRETEPGFWHHEPAPVPLLLQHRPPIEVKAPKKSLLKDKCWLFLHVKFKVLFIAVGPEFNYPQGKGNQHKTINYADVLDNIFILYLRDYMYRMTNDQATFLMEVNEAAAWNIVKYSTHTPKIWQRMKWWVTPTEEYLSLHLHRCQSACSPCWRIQSRRNVLAARLKLWNISVFWRIQGCAKAGIISDLWKSAWKGRFIKRIEMCLWIKELSWPMKETKRSPSDRKQQKKKSKPVIALSYHKNYLEHIVNRSRTSVKGFESSARQFIFNQAVSAACLIDFILILTHF